MVGLLMTILSESDGPDVSPGPLHYSPAGWTAVNYADSKLDRPSWRRFLRKDDDRIAHSGDLLAVLVAPRQRGSDQVRSRSNASIVRVRCAEHRSVDAISSEAAIVDTPEWRTRTACSCRQH